MRLTPLSRLCFLCVTQAGKPQLNKINQYRQQLSNTPADSPNQIRTKVPIEKSRVSNPTSSYYCQSRNDTHEPKPFSVSGAFVKINPERLAKFVQKLFNLECKRNDCKRYWYRKAGHIVVDALNPLAYPKAGYSDLPGHHKRKVYHEVQNPKAKRPLFRPVFIFQNTSVIVVVLTRTCSAGCTCSVFFRKIPANISRKTTSANAPPTAYGAIVTRAVPTATIAGITA